MKFFYFIFVILGVAVLVNAFRHPFPWSAAKLADLPQLPGLTKLQDFATERISSSTEVSDLVNRCSKFLLVVDGDQGMGSASIIKWKGNSLIVTNIHVLSGNAHPRFRLLNGQKLAPDTLGVPVDRDILVASQRQVPDGLEASAAVDTEAAIGDEVIVLGNSLGSNVVTEVKGKILGIGPDLIETDAKFVSGNSGSPIIHVKTGKVIAIATFATVRKLDAISNDSQFNKVRRFGYRFDTISKWEFVTAQNFAGESGLLAEIRQRNDDLFTLAKEAAKDRYVKASHYRAGSWAGGIVDSFCNVGPRNGVGAIKFEQAVKVFRERVTDDIVTANQMKMIPYHQAELAGEVASRKVLVNFLEKIDWNNVEFDR